MNNWLQFGLTIDQDRKAVGILQHTFTYEKKAHPANNICKQRRSLNEREVLSI